MPQNQAPTNLSDAANQCVIALAITAWLAGLTDIQPAILASIVSLLAIQYFFAPPHDEASQPRRHSSAFLDVLDETEASELLPKP